MSGARIALDTNVLVYAIDTADQARSERAQALLRRLVANATGMIALQSVGEFYAAVTRKGLQSPSAAARQARDWMTLFPVAAPAAADAGVALDAAAASRLSYWDALMLATLGRAGCAALLSEDMHDGVTVGPVTIRNPFVGESLPEAVEALLG